MASDSGSAVAILIAVVAVTVLLFVLLLLFLRRRTTFRRRRTDTLAALEGSLSHSIADLEKPPLPQAIWADVPVPRSPRHKPNMSQVSLSSLVMTASLAGPGIAKPISTQGKPGFRNSHLSVMSADWKELGLPPPPMIAEAGGRGRHSRVLSIGAWRKRKTVRMTFYAM